MTARWSSSWLREVEDELDKADPLVSESGRGPGLAGQRGDARGRCCRWTGLRLRPSTGRGNWAGPRAGAASRETASWAERRNGPRGRKREEYLGWLEKGLREKDRAGQAGRLARMERKGFFLFILFSYFQTTFKYEPNATSNKVLNILFNSNKMNNFSKFSNINFHNSFIFKFSFLLFQSHFYVICKKKFNPF